MTKNKNDQNNQKQQEVQISINDRMWNFFYFLIIMRASGKFESFEYYYINLFVHII